MAATGATPATPGFRSLASSLIRRTVLVASFCAILAGGLQAAVTITEEKKAFERALRGVADVNVPLLSVLLWDIEPEAVRRQLRQIASQPEIAYARLEARTGQQFEAGDASLRDPRPRRSRFPTRAGRKERSAAWRFRPIARRW